MTRNGALAGMVTGGLTVVVWKQYSGGLFDLYEIVPGFMLSFIVIVVISLIDRRPEPEISEEFNKFRQQLTTTNTE